MSYLFGRSVFCNFDKVNVRRFLTRGCPQGSCIAPVLWNIYINSVLSFNYNFGFKFYLQAFADDLVMLVPGGTRPALEINVPFVLTRVVEVLESLKLGLSIGKTKIMSVRRRVRGKKPVFDRRPIYYFRGQKVAEVESVRILGITLECNLTWSAHILDLYERCYVLHSRLHSVVGGSWGVNSDTVGVWVRCVAERIMLYGSPVWGRELSTVLISRLRSIHRHFLLKISRGYRTSGYDKLCVVLGFLPIDLLIKRECLRYDLRNDNALPPSLLNGATLDRKFLFRSCSPGRRCLANLLETPLNTGLVAYTDGSRMDDGVGLSVCIFNNDLLINVICVQLNFWNSVFQAELYAIYLAVDWAVKYNNRVNIITDSLSSLAVLQGVQNSSLFVQGVKDFLGKHLDKFSLQWTRAHVGTFGNELADLFAKASISRGRVVALPAPFSYGRRCIDVFIFGLWQADWDRGHGDSDVHRYIPDVKHRLEIRDRGLILALLGHGPFPAYLHRFRLRDSPLCSCGVLGDVGHFLFRCPHTAACHLPDPGQHHFAWLKRVCSSPFLLRRIRQCINVSHSLVNPP